jgi:hypothetical protein
MARTTWLFVIPLVMSMSCDRGTSATTVPASAAYTDGFQVVVFEFQNDVPAKARSLPLKEAEKAIQEGSQAFIPDDGTAVQEQLSTGKTGDSRVILALKALDGEKQQVQVGFHESSRTFVYEYVVHGTRVIPLESAYSDLGKSKIVRYGSE